jgi:predicted GIY-YIG superfamily endonuclease
MDLILTGKSPPPPHNQHSLPAPQKNVVYAIKCASCGQLYIGETKRMLSERFREHRRDVISKKTDISPVAQHFTNSGHNLEDMSVAILAQCTNERQRKMLEMRIIQKLGTLFPKGMNVDFSLNV